MLPIALVLVLVTAAAQGAPGLGGGDLLHALQNVVGHFGTAILKALALPVGRVFDEFLSSSTVLDLSLVYVQRSQSFTLFPMV